MHFPPWPFSELTKAKCRILLYFVLIFPSEIFIRVSFFSLWFHSLPVSLLCFSPFYCFRSALVTPGHDSVRSPSMKMAPDDDDGKAFEMPHIERRIKYPSSYRRHSVLSSILFLYLQVRLASGMCRAGSDQRSAAAAMGGQRYYAGLLECGI